VHKKVEKECLTTGQNIWNPVYVYAIFVLQLHGNFGNKMKCVEKQKSARMKVTPEKWKPFKRWKDLTKASGKRKEGESWKEVDLALLVLCPPNFSIFHLALRPSGFIFAALIIN
jgi:hypothetical protein